MLLRKIFQWDLENSCLSVERAKRDCLDSHGLMNFEWCFTPSHYDMLLSFLLGWMSSALRRSPDFLFLITDSQLSSIILEHCAVLSYTQKPSQMTEYGPQSRVFLVILLPTYVFMVSSPEDRALRIKQMWDVTPVLSFSNTVWDGRSRYSSGQRLSTHKCYPLVAIQSQTCKLCLHSSAWVSDLKYHIFL